MAAIDEQGDYTQKRGPGDPLVIRADFHNSLCDVVKWFREGAGQRQGAADSIGVGDEGPITLLVHNTTGAAVGQFGILTVNAPTILPSASATAFAERRALDGVAPDASSVFVVTQEPIGAGAIGGGIIAGHTPCKLKINNLADTYAGPIAGDTTQLGSAGSGPARIIWMDTSGGTGALKDAVVLLIGDNDDAECPDGTLGSTLSDPLGCGSDCGCGGSTPPSPGSGCLGIYHFPSGVIDYWASFNAAGVMMQLFPYAVWDGQPGGAGYTQAQAIALTGLSPCAGGSSPTPPPPPLNPVMVGGGGPGQVPNLPPSLPRPGGGWQVGGGGGGGGGVLLPMPPGAAGGMPGGQQFQTRPLARPNLGTTFDEMLGEPLGVGAAALAEIAALTPAAGGQYAAMKRPTQFAPGTGASTSFASGTSYAHYFGVAEAAWTTVTVRVQTSAPLVGITWAEAAIYKATPTLGGSPTLTRMGWLDVSGILNANGQFNLAITVSGVAAGNQLWLVLGFNAVQVCVLTGGSTDPLNTGWLQFFNGRPSTTASVTPAIANANGAAFDWSAA
jgi:hypothetical protein